MFVYVCVCVYIEGCPLHKGLCYLWWVSSRSPRDYLRGTQLCFSAPSARLFQHLLWPGVIASSGLVSSERRGLWLWRKVEREREREWYRDRDVPPAFYISSVSSHPLWSLSVEPLSLWAFVFCWNTLCFLVLVIRGRIPSNLLLSMAWSGRFMLPTFSPEKPFTAPFSLFSLPPPTCFTHRPKTTLALLSVMHMDSEGKCCMLTERKILVQHGHGVYCINKHEHCLLLLWTDAWWTKISLCHFKRLPKSHIIRTKKFIMSNVTPSCVWNLNTLWLVIKMCLQNRLLSASNAWSDF